MYPFQRATLINVTLSLNMTCRALPNFASRTVEGGDASTKDVPGQRGTCDSVQDTEGGVGASTLDVQKELLDRRRCAQLTEAVVAVRLVHSGSIYTFPYSLPCHVAEPDTTAAFTDILDLLLLNF